MHILKLGDRGKEVLDVQARLFGLGFDVGTDGVDGLFGPDTLAAVLIFQQRNGLLADGIVSENTWQELVESRYEPGERLLYLRIPPFRGADVLALQRALNRLGFNAGPEDGIFGARTERAVLDFQKNSGLQLDGMVDETVLKAMNKVTKDGEPHCSEAKIPDRNGGYAVGRDVSQLTFAIDAGHGGDDDGFMCDSGIKEKDINLGVAMYLARALETLGARVVMLRQDDETMSVYDRSALANQSGADLYVSIHHNANGNRLAQGAAAYYFSRHGYYSEPGITLARHVISRMAAGLDVTGLPPMGRNYAVLRETEMTAVQVEPLFMTAAGFGALLDEGLHEREGEAILAGILEYFEQG